MPYCLLPEANIRRFNRWLKAADRVVVCFTSDHDTASQVGNCPRDRGVGPNGGISDLDARSIAGDLNAIAIIAGDNTGSDRVVAASRSDQDPVKPVGRGKVLEGRDSAEGIE